MEILQQRLFADEGQRVGEMLAEPPHDGLVRIEAVEVRGGREERAGERPVLACASRECTVGREEAGRHGLVNLIRKRNKHKGVPRPDVQVVGVEQKGGIAARFLRGASRHLQLEIIVRNIPLLIVHPVRTPVDKGVVSSGPRTPQRKLGVIRG